MDKRKAEYYKNKLYDEKKRIKDIIKRLDEDMGLGDSILDETSELSLYDNHPADIGSETFEIEKNKALKANEIEHLKQVEEALKKIDEGKYGICEICGRQISEERLEAVPYAALCIDCERKEKADYKTYQHDRPVEETVLGYPFGVDVDIDDYEDYTGYDGEDVWQELESFDSPNYFLWDDDEDEGMQGVVEETDKISNEQYKRQLPD